MKNKNVCPKTLSGKHMWRAVNEDWTTIREGLKPITYYLKCEACGMIDDKIKNYPKGEKND